MHATPDFLFDLPARAHRPARARFTAATGNAALYLLPLVLLAAAVWR